MPTLGQGSSLVGGYGGGNADPNGTSQVTTGLASSVLNITAPTVVKAAPGRMGSLTIIVAGSAGTLTINDCATTGAATAANTIWQQAYNAAAAVAGQLVKLDWPCATGIVISSVPTGCTLAVTYN